MNYSEQLVCGLLDRVVHEGEPDLVRAPFGERSLPAEVPEQWHNLLQASDPRGAVMDLWRPLRDRLPRVYRGMRDRLRAVALLCTEEIPASLLYLFQGGGEVFAYRGWPPVPGERRAALPWPKEWCDFYGIHDGWTSLHTEDDGPMRSEECGPVMELYPDVERWIPSGLARAGDLQVVYRDEPDVALAIDASDPSSPAYVCAADGTMEPLLDLWAEIDRRVGGILAELDWASPNSEELVASDPAADQAAERRYARVMARYELVRSSPKGLLGSFLHEQAAEIALQRAWIATRQGGSENTIREHLRTALEAWCIGIERSEPKIGADELQSMFSVAQHLGDARQLAFIATIPRELWQDDSPLALASAITFDLFLAEESRLLPQAEQLQGTPADEEDPAPLYTRAVTGMALALARRDPGQFQLWRERVLAEHPAAPTDVFADFPWSLRIQGFDLIARRLGLLG